MSRLRPALALGFLAIGCLATAPAHAQAFATTYRSPLTGTGHWYRIQATPDGGYAALGSIDGPIVTKFFPSGQIEWAHPLGNLDNVYVTETDGSFGVTAAGDLVVAGTTRNLQPGNFNGVWVGRFALHGGLVWQKTLTIGTVFGPLTIGSMTIAGSDQIIIGGRVPTSTTETRPFQFSLSGSGDLQWARAQSSDGGVDLARIGVDSYLGIGYRSLTRYNLAGDPIWHQEIGLPNFPDQFWDLSSVRVGADGSIYAVGRRDQRGAEAAFDVVVLKFSADGNLLWGRTVSDPSPLRASQDFATGLAIAPTGELYISGTSKQTAGQDQPDDGRILKLSSAGAVLWQLLLGGTNRDVINDIAATKDGGAVSAGLTQSWAEPRLGEAWLVRPDRGGVVTLGCNAGRFSNSTTAPISVSLTPAVVTTEVVSVGNDPSGISAQSASPLRTALCVGKPTEVSPAHALVPLSVGSNGALAWESEGYSNSNKFQLYRRRLQSGIPVTDAGSCLASSIAGTGYIDSTQPLPGEAFGYIVGGVNNEGRGTLGYSSNGVERAPLAFCP